MSIPYNNNNQGLGFSYNNPNHYMGNKINTVDRIDPYSKSKMDSILFNDTPEWVNAQVPRSVDAKPTAEKSWTDSLGDYWKKGKEAVWGTPVTKLRQDAAGNFDTSVMDLKQWEDFSKAGGYVGADGQLFNKDGTAFELGKTEGGLGELFTVNSLKTAGEAANNLGKVFGMYQAADDIFGQGAKSRREAERQAKADFEQRYAMNQMAMDKFREDNEHFKQQRAAITASY